MRRRILDAPIGCSSVSSPKFVPCKEFISGDEVWVGGRFPIGHSGAIIQVEPVPLAQMGPGFYSISLEISAGGPATEQFAFRGTFKLMADVACDGAVIPDEYTLKFQLDPQDPNSLKFDSHGRFWTPVSPAKTKGIVLLMHGQSGKTDPVTAYQRYDYLLKCLAANGFFAVAVQGNTIKKLDKIPLVEQHLDHIINVASAQSGIPNAAVLPLGLIGHSEGGEVVAIVADRVRQGKVVGLPAKVVLSVIALASTASELKKEPPPYTPNFAQGLLVMHGTHDGDKPSADDIRLVEYSAASVRCFLFMHGCNHFCFQDSSNKVEKPEPDFPLDSKFVPADLATHVLRRTQNLVTQKYVTMFMLWRLAGRTEFASVFRGTTNLVLKAPPGDQLMQIDIDTRLRVFPFRREAIAEGDKPLCAQDSDSCYTFVGLVNELTIVKKPKSGPASSLAPLVRGESVAYRFRWLHWSHPNPAIFISSFGSLSGGVTAIEFEIIEINVATCNKLNNDLSTVAIGLIHESLAPAWQDFTIPKSLEIKTWHNGNLSQTLMATIRVPLDSFMKSSDYLSGVSVIALDWSDSRKTGDVLFTKLRLVTT